MCHIFCFVSFKSCIIRSKYSIAIDMSGVLNYFVWQAIMSQRQFKDILHVCGSNEHHCIALCLSMFSEVNNGPNKNGLGG